MLLYAADNVHVHADVCSVKRSLHPIPRVASTASSRFQNSTKENTGQGSDKKLNIPFPTEFKGMRQRDPEDCRLVTDARFTDTGYLLLLKRTTRPLI